MYRLLNYPHPTLFFNEEELEDIVGEEVPFVNTMTCSHYRDFCGRIGFRTLLWQEIEEPAEAAMLGRYPKTFQKFPVEDLRVPLLNVVLWKPRRDELPSYPGVPRVTRGPAADWREGLARIHPFQVESRYGAAAHFLRAHPRILDVGCRTGAGAQYLAQLGGDVVGIDSDRAAIQLARQRPGGARFVCGKPLPVLKELTRQLDLVVLDAAAVCAASYTSQTELATLVCRRLARGGIVMIHSASESYVSQRLARNGLRMIYDGPALTRTGGRATMGPCLQVLEDRNGRSTER
jgi:SAM-dependent methyltransferase